MTISDTQTGLRALPREAVEELVDVAGDRFEYETNMLLAFKEKAIPFEENKIRTVYIEENKSSHFRTFVDSWRIYKLILAHFFRYTINSIVCAVVDTGLFTLFTALLKKALEGFALTAAAGAGARVISSLLNFFLNKKLVFKTNADTGKTLLRYYCLAVPQMLLQILLTDGAYVLFHVKPTGVLHTLIYVIVMILLYIIGLYDSAVAGCLHPRNKMNPRLRKMSKRNTMPDYDPVPSQRGGASRPPKKKKKKGSGLFGRIVRRFFLVLFTVIALILVAACLAANLIFNGPSPAARDILTMTLLEPSGTKWIPGLFMDAQTLDSIRTRDDPPEGRVFQHV